ncbi:MAG TPA: hypothetical protein ENI79_04755 [Rhodospirillales bacterium]|nr:hypothetical protein [Rhodospirillales bacterium]
MSESKRKPKGVTLNELAAPIRADILNAIDSAADESAQAIYDRFGLSQRDVNISWFRRHVSERRRQPDFTPQPVSDEVPSWIDLDKMMRASIAERVRGGDVKVYEFAAVLKRCFEERLVRLKEEQAEQEATKFKEWERKRDAELASQHKEAERSMRESGLSDEAINRIHGIYGIGSGHVDG